MATTAHICLSGDSPVPRVDMLYAAEKRFVAIFFEGLTVNGAIFDERASVWARGFAERLLAAADQIDSALQPEGAMCDDRR